MVTMYLRCSSILNFLQDAEIPLADEFALFKKLCDVLYEQKLFDQLQRVTFSAMGSPYFNKKPELMKVGLAN